jgi:histidinol-phosphate aminotransferase
MEENSMIYVNENVKNTHRVPQPEGRGAYIRLDQNENPDGLPKWLFDSVMKKVTPEFLAIYPEETIPTTKYAHLLGLKKENVTFTAEVPLEWVM